jgi:hypothetical protein
MAKIESEILTGLSVEDAFGLAADRRKRAAVEPAYGRAAKITHGPVSQDTVFRSATESIERTAEMST